MNLWDMVNAIVSNPILLIGIPFIVMFTFALYENIIRSVDEVQDENKNHHFEWPKDEDKTVYYPETKPIAYHQPNNRCPYCGTPRTHFDQADCPKCGGPYGEE
jgi:hypothetical protein